MDQDQAKSFLANSNEYRRTLEAGGMRGAHESLAGRVRLLYSTTQQDDNRKILSETIVKSPESVREKAGCKVALDVESGKVVRFTDVDIVEGNAHAIDFNIRPCGMPKTFHPDLDQNYDDWQNVGEVDPRNLIMLQSDYGSDVYHRFEDANPRYGSLVSYYGREKALEIVTMLRDLPDDVRPKGIYNGRGFDKFDDIIATGRQITPADMHDGFRLNASRSTNSVCLISSTLFGTVTSSAEPPKPLLLSNIQPPAAAPSAEEASKIEGGADGNNSWLQSKKNQPILNAFRAAAIICKSIVVCTAGMAVSGLYLGAYGGWEVGKVFGTTVGIMTTLATGNPVTGVVAGVSTVVGSAALLAGGLGALGTAAGPFAGALLAIDELTNQNHSFDKMLPESRLFTPMITKLRHSEFRKQIKDMRHFVEAMNWASPSSEDLEKFDQFLSHDARSVTAEDVTKLLNDAIRDDNTKHWDRNVAWSVLPVILKYRPDLIAESLNTLQAEAKAQKVNFDLDESMIRDGRIWQSRTRLPPRNDQPRPGPLSLNA